MACIVMPRSERAAYKKQVLGLSSKPAGACWVWLNQTNCLQPALIPAARWDRRQDCRAAESPACCRHRVSVRGSPDQRRWADTTPRRISPVCRRTARPAGRLWCPLAQRCLAAATVALVSNRLRARAQAEPSEPAASLAQAGLARSPRPTPPSERMRKKIEGSFSFGENGRGARRFPIKRRTFLPLPRLREGAGDSLP